MYLFALLTACDPANPYSFSGIVTSDLFPFDGDRTWEYISTDLDLSYKLIATIQGSVQQDGKNVYTVQYAKECVANDPYCVTGEVLRTIQWSSTTGDGVHIHGYTVGANPVEFDPPIQLTLSTMKKDETAVTTTAGAEWTSTMLGTDACPISFSANWDECGVWTLESTAADGYPLTGTYWAAATNNLAAIELDGDLGQWQLSDLDCEGDCNGIW